MYLDNNYYKSMSGTSQEKGKEKSYKKIIFWFSCKIWKLTHSLEKSSPLTLNIFYFEKCCSSIINGSLNGYLHIVIYYLRTRVST